LLRFDEDQVIVTALKSFLERKNMRVTRIALVLLGLFLSFKLHAQLTFSGPATFGSAFTDGTLSPAPVYTVTSPATGINLSGDFYVTLPSGTTTGRLLQWYVDRPIASGIAPFNITVSLTGFTSLTSGSGGGGGLIGAAIYNSGALLSGTQTISQFSYAGLLTNFSQSNTNTITSYTYTPGDTLRLYYDSTLNYTGAGGTYDVNFPASVSISVPEPTCTMFIAGAMGLLAMRRKR
jgi:hypothetical protein